MAAYRLGETYGSLNELLIKNLQPLTLDEVIELAEANTRRSATRVFVAELAVRGLKAAQIGANLGITRNSVNHSASRHRHLHDAIRELKGISLTGLGSTPIAPINAVE